MTQYGPILALDLGDRWIGMAVSDGLGMFSRPLKTVQRDELHATLEQLILEYSLFIIVVGYPKTLRNTHSQQTEKVLAFFDTLKNNFPLLQWKLQDERLSSKYAAQIKGSKTKDEKINSHSIAAAIILQDYLESQRLLRESVQNA